MMIIFVMALLALSVGTPVKAENIPLSPDSSSPTDSVTTDNKLTVSLITCWPGPEVYELCGHEAIRIKGENLDSVWNYGVFSFNQPNFIYRFVKGETDYMVAGYPFRYFLPEYIARGSKVLEQELNLTQEEAVRLRSMLQEEALPKNCVYRYNYVRNNCATRIIDRLDSAVDQRIIYPDTISYGTFRKEMRAYHRDYPWYQFGIDLALGSRLDQPIRARNEMFVPVEMARSVASAHFADGRPLVKESRILFDGVEDATLGPTPFWATPLAVSTVVFLLCVALCYLQWRKRKIFRWVYSIFFGILGLTGIVISFLVFVSEHEATSPNALILWLNPIQLLLAVFVWWRSTRIISLSAAVYDVAVTGCLLIAWPFQTQSANPSFFPLMGATVLLAACYAIIAVKYSYKNNIPDSPARSGAGKSGKNSRNSGLRTGIK